MNTPATEGGHAEPNIDPAEIAKFENLARRWWDPESEFRPLHQINPLRLEYLRERVAIRGLNVLDVGCGGGILTESMARCGASVTGIDAGETPISVARLHALESRLEIDYRHCTPEDMADDHSAYFDLITCMEMLEHVPDPSAVLRACRRMLRPGGHLLLSTINRNPRSYLFAVVGAEYLLNLLPRGTHDYAKFIRPSELTTWLRQEHFELLDMTGMTYNPLNRRYRLTPDVEVNYMVLARG